jgi:hypothetical protein
MSFLFLQSRAAKNYPLIQENIITNIGGLTDDNPGAMVNKEPSPDSCPRVNFNICQETINVGKPPSQKVKLALPQIMSRTM